MTLAGIIFVVIVIMCLVSNVMWVLVWRDRVYGGLGDEVRRVYGGLPGVHWSRKERVDRAVQLARDLEAIEDYVYPDGRLCYDCGFSHTIEEHRENVKEA